MITVQELLVILIFHWLGDFWLQTDWQARNKSSRWDALLGHTALYSLIWILPIFAYGIATKCPLELLWAIPITFICHTITDYYTSREVKKHFDAKDTHEGFMVIGLDQILHYVQLVITYILLR